ncbi:UDP-N-acetylmuramoyl-L-alanyl-D-glutamate--2,6-diaminopimelate ligase [Bacillus niameyensis]|uniref:UDP-N-acetylmuramoyl-L-alanyl-D-glutamate--2, 6-diaminopimelate ligase n=1 Tax=Bacillus niameyensis TaxID=1522308 RepID=UPI000784F071|nr:UDP-N-acetylmuramoyl-L-alanyl-D-glutamate--2,6-diaminopimelate ligase [Bacillus niameyensis]
MKLHTLFESYPIIKLPNSNPEITGIANNHVHIAPGNLFVCISGYKVDGHNFAKDAVKNGAVAVVAEKDLDLGVPVIKVKDTKKAMAILADAFYDHPTQKLHLIGITGTNGKTTTSYLINSIFKDSEHITGLIGTLSVNIANQVHETKNTTPDSLALQSIFHKMRENDVETAVMEVSSHALVQGRVNGCDFDVAVFTNLTQDHLDFHHTMEEYKSAKALLFSKLGNVYKKNQLKFAVLNADDPASNLFATETSAHVVTYGIDSEADFTASDVKLGHNGASFTLQYPDGAKNITLKLTGRFNVYNALASIAAAYVSNLPIDTIIQSIEKATGVPGRFELVDGGQDFSVIVDYAHTPDSLENVLKTIKQFAKKRIYCVVGCGGDRDPSKRPIMAKIACQYASNPIFTSDNPRSEDPLAILDDMEKGVIGSNYEIIADRKEAIHKAIQASEHGDVVLIAGKGHETYQIIGEKVYDFDDRLVALAAIKTK